MSLGQTLYRLRKEKNLSQEELAERLSVSRQSISKWETDASVPELDKLIRLADVFAVSLDELIREGASMAPSTPGTYPTEEIVALPSEAFRDPTPQPRVGSGEEKGMALARRIVAVALWGIGLSFWAIGILLSDFWLGLIYSAPFVVCGTICFCFRRRAWLWCLWALYGMMDLYLTFSTVFRKLRLIQVLFFHEAYTWVEMVFGLFWMGMLYGLGGLTLFSFRQTRQEGGLTALKRVTAAGVISLGVTRIASYLIAHLHTEISLGSRLLQDARVLISFSSEWVYIVAHTVILVTVFTAWMTARAGKGRSSSLEES